MKEGEKEWKVRGWVETRNRSERRNRKSKI